MNKAILKPAALLMAVILAITLTGCAQTTEQVQQHPRTATGAAVGGVGGAVVGGLLGGGKGALIGGLLGALGGGVIGNYTEKKSATREQTLRETGTAPGGNELDLQKVSVKPESVAPGGQVDIGLTYALLTPKADEQATVKETRQIMFNNQVVGQMAVDRSRTSGTWDSSVPVTLPQSAQPGTYTVVASVQSGTMSDKQQATFTVK